jgi:hypothetical protein
MRNKLHGIIFWTAKNTEFLAKAQQIMRLVKNVPGGSDFFSFLTL